MPIAIGVAHAGAGWSTPVPPRQALLIAALLHTGLSANEETCGEVFRRMGCIETDRHGVADRSSLSGPPPDARSNASSVATAIVAFSPGLCLPIEKSSQIDPEIDDVSCAVQMN
jgi:hypothetical protein